MSGTGTDAYGSSQPIEEYVDESRVLTVAGGPERAIISGTMMVYRHQWGPTNGWRTFRLNWVDIQEDSVVMASVCEGPFIGNARILLYNVATRAGGVDIHVHVDWGSPIPLRVDYLAILRSL